MAKGKTKRLMERRRFLKRLHGKMEEAEESKKTKSASEPDPNADEFFKDEIDLFHEKKQQVQRDRSGLLEPALSSSSSEEDEEEEVMGLGLDDSEGDGELTSVEGDGNDKDSADKEEKEEKEEEEREEKEEEEEEREEKEEEEEEEGSDIDEMQFGAYEQKLLSRFEKYLHSSDEEMRGEGEGEGEGQLTDKSWGRSKKAFYSTDFIDDEIGGPSDQELAEEEEVEAIALQRQMAEELAEGAYAAPEKVVVKEATFHRGAKIADRDETAITADFSKLSQEEKLQLLAKESPELFELLDEYKAKLEVVVGWQPLMDSIGADRGHRFTEQGKELLQLLFHSYLIYCLNLAFYLKLKAQRQPVKTHPVIGRIAEMRTALSQLQGAEAHLRPQVEQALQLLQEKGCVGEREGAGENKGDEGEGGEEVVSVGGEVDAMVSSMRQKLERDRKRGVKRKTDQVSGASKTGKRAKKKDKDTFVPTKDEDDKIPDLLDNFDPEEYYETVKAEKERRKHCKKDRLSGSKARHAEEDEVLLGPDGKRAITYQIARNKGLTPKRKKEQRNPRVKHRKKFDRAKVRRRGQVRSVVADEGVYGGERSGIKSTVSRSIKLK